jgi:hypothetical protein
VTANNHAGRIADEKRLLSPVSGSTRLSFTLGALTATALELVITSRSLW